MEEEIKHNVLFIMFVLIFQILTTVAVTILVLMEESVRTQHQIILNAHAQLDFQGKNVKFVSWQKVLQ